MEYQLRTYEVKPGERDVFVEFWRAQVVPLRRAHGFELVGAWTSGDDGFVWLLSYDGDYAAAEAAYNASPERRSMDPDPASFLAAIETRLMTAVAP